MERPLVCLLVAELKSRRSEGGYRGMTMTSVFAIIDPGSPHGMGLPVPTICLRKVSGILDRASRPAGSERKEKNV